MSRQFIQPPLRLVRKVGQLLGKLVTASQHQPAPFHFQKIIFLILD
jgi:hypothetical protein